MCSAGLQTGESEPRSGLTEPRFYEPPFNRPMPNAMLTERPPISSARLRAGETGTSFGVTGHRFFRPPCVQVKTDSDPAWKRSERRGKGPNFSGCARKLRGRNAIGVDRPSIFRPLSERTRPRRDPDRPSSDFFGRRRFRVSRSPIRAARPPIFPAEWRLNRQNGV